MKKPIRFRRNVYIILIGILLLGILTQFVRSDILLKVSLDKQHAEDTKWAVLETRLASATTTSSTNFVDNANHHCVVMDPNDDTSTGIVNNLKQVYRYIKDSYQLQDVTQHQLDFNACSAVLITTDLEQLDEYISMIEQYVYSGGYFFLMRMDDPGVVLTQIYRKLGIINYEYIVGNSDILLTSNLLIGQKDQLFKDDYFYNDSLLVELDPKSTIYAKGSNLTPLIWSNDYGDGRFMVYNGSNLEMKANRGLIVGAISLLIPNYIYPIFNSKLFYIDDFPAPISSRVDSRIYAEYRKSLPAFFKDIWWPDMIQAARKYDLKYTAVAIQTYEDDVEAPFNSALGDDITTLIAYGREVLKSGGEIGIHGYNHQPLQMNKEIADYYKYVPWASVHDMEAAVAEVVSLLQSIYPNYTAVSYVPPSNILGPQGRQALINKWPDLKVISSLYEQDSLGYGYIQEYEIASDGIIEMPRTTSGYFDTPDMRWTEVNAMTSLGIISHFLHPDDLLDKRRNGNKNWAELKESFEGMLNRIHDTYPWLRAQTSAEAAMDMSYVLNSQVSKIIENAHVNVSIEGQYTTQYFILRSEKHIGKLKNCDVKKIDENTYLVAANSPHFTIQLK